MWVTGEKKKRNVNAKNSFKYQLIFQSEKKCRSLSLNRVKMLWDIIFIRCLCLFICLQDFAAYLAFCGIVLHNAQLYETSLLENRRNQVWSTGLSQEYKNYDGQLKSAPFPCFWYGSKSSAIFNYSSTVEL